MAAIMPIKRHKMNELTLANRAADWHRLKALVLDSVSSPITKRVYNPGLDEFIAWYSQEPRPGFTKATVAAWRVALEARGLGSVSINVRITAVRKLAVEAADNGLLAPELANSIARVKGVASKGDGMKSKPVALVTEANKGIGLQIAKDLAAHGFTVLVVSRSLDYGETAAKSIGADARALQLDVTNQASIGAAAERIRNEFGRLDVRALSIGNKIARGAFL
jgi:hypothetical protein